jgi:hypothetical protein
LDDDGTSEVTKKEIGYIVAFLHGSGYDARSLDLGLQQAKTNETLNLTSDEVTFYQDMLKYEFRKIAYKFSFDKSPLPAKTPPKA